MDASSLQRSDEDGQKGIILTEAVLSVHGQASFPGSRHFRELRYKRPAWRGRTRAQTASQTAMKVTNAGGSDVRAWITLGVPPGCVNSVASLPFVTNVVNPLQGSFILKRRSSIICTPPPGQCLNGNIAF